MDENVIRYRKKPIRAPDKRTFLQHEPTHHVFFARVHYIFEYGGELWVFVEYYEDEHANRKGGNCNWKSDV